MKAQLWVESHQPVPLVPLSMLKIEPGDVIYVGKHMTTDGEKECPGWVLAGTDADRAGRVADQAVALLSKARSLTDQEFKAQRDELEKAAREVASQATPDEVLRHVAERALAQLLSNPRLESALKARLK